MEKQKLEQEVELLKQEFFKTKSIRVYGRKKKQKYVPKDIITIYSYDETEYLL